MPESGVGGDVVTTVLKYNFNPELFSSKVKIALSLCTRRRKNDKTTSLKLGKSDKYGCNNPEKVTKMLGCMRKKS